MLFVCHHVFATYSESFVVFFCYVFLLNSIKLFQIFNVMFYLKTRQDIKILTANLLVGICW